jgi:uncharacterized protein YkwD
MTSRTRATRLATGLSATALVGASLFGSASPAAASGPSRAELRAAVVKLTNQMRADKGCKPLRTSERLTKAAQRHANDMAAKNYFSHTSLNGTQWYERIRAAGYHDAAGENIAYGFATPRGVVKAWMKSPGHRRNILDCSFKAIGVGYNGDGKYWVQDFGF